MLLNSDVVFFKQKTASEISACLVGSEMCIRDSYSALAMADVFIAIGTSGHVYPAAGFVHEARLQGAHTVELNLEPSQVGSEFEEKHYGLASEVVPAFVDKLLKGL